MLHRITPLISCVLLACFPPKGNPSDWDGDGSTVDSDCDDSDATIFPEAVETCDGIDNNCDGDTDELTECSPGGIDDINSDQCEFSGEQPIDAISSILLSDSIVGIDPILRFWTVGDLLGDDGVPELVIQDTHSESQRLQIVRFTSFDPVVTELIPLMLLQENDSVNVFSVGDMNNDGTNELAIATFDEYIYEEEDQDTDDPRVFIVSMFEPKELVAAEEVIELAASNSSETRFRIIEFEGPSSQESGASMTSGDFNGDGLTDLVLSSATSQSGDGRVLLLYGGEWVSTDWDSAISLSAPPSAFVDSTAVMNWPDSERGFGSPVQNIGDINSDGMDDLAVGTRGTLEHTAELFVFDGVDLPRDAIVAYSDVAQITHQNSDFYGLKSRSSLAFRRRPDITGDGLDELVIGVPPFGDDDESWVHVVNNYYSVQSKFKTAAWANFEGDTSSQIYHGTSLDVGYFDGDCTADLLLGSNLASGRIALFHGSTVKGDFGLGDQWAYTAGEEPWSNLSRDLRTFSDIDDDGNDEMIFSTAVEQSSSEINILMIKGGR